MAFNLTGKKVLVTGAGRGIGKGLALALADTGCDVYALSRQQANLDALVEISPKIHAIQADLTDWDDTRRALENLEPMDGLVNNAAVFHHVGPALTMPKEFLDKTWAVNVYGAINVTQIIGAKMAEAGKGGSIVNVSTIGGLSALCDMLAYCTSKAALDMMTKQFALELGPNQIRVNSVNLSSTYTESSRQFHDNPAIGGKILAQTPIGRLSEVSDVVGPIMYLLSDHSSMVTGTMHTVDGGLMAGISV